MLSALARLVLLVLLSWVTLSGCRGESAGGAAPAGSAVTLTLAAYTTPREAYAKILPAFAAAWKQKTGRVVTFQESYQGSGAQARAIVGGFEADVAALSLEPDIRVIEEAKLLGPGWKSGPHAGMVTRSVVAIGVRRGNPKGIAGWEDLAAPGVKVLTPNVRTSGGAMWNVLAIYGAALRGHAGTPRGNEAAAVALLGRIFANVEVMDRSGRDSLLTFERGVADAIITYENELLVGQARGQDYELIVPPSTILIENPVAIVEANVARHGAQDVAAAFVEFLRTPDVQRTFAETGFRPVDEAVAAELGGRFARVDDLFTVADLGGWDAVQKAVFSSGGAYDRALGDRGR